jgi:hypothetical protein
MRKKRRPCAFCRKWFEPDARVGERQRACSAEECQRKRRAATQAAWRRGQPDYFIARRIQERAKREREEGRAPPPLRMPAPLDRLPWDLAQDELGVQGTDLLGVLGKVLLRHGQDQMAAQAQEITREFREVLELGAQDQTRPRA